MQYTSTLKQIKLLPNLGFVAEPRNCGDGGWERRVWLMFLSFLILLSSSRQDLLSKQQAVLLVLCQLATLDPWAGAREGRLRLPLQDGFGFTRPGRCIELTTLWAHAWALQGLLAKDHTWRLLTTLAWTHVPLQCPQPLEIS